MTSTRKHLSPVKLARRNRILDAAQGLFLTRGLKATTVEGIAEAVGMSKVTVYGYFPHKDAIFEAVVRRFFRLLHSTVDDALKVEGTPCERVFAVLQAKHGLVFELVRISPHAKELFAAKDHYAEMLDALDEHVTIKLGKILNDDKAARLLFNASTGMVELSRTRADFDEDLERLCRAVCED